MIRLWILLTLFICGLPSDGRPQPVPQPYAFETCYRKHRIAVTQDPRFWSLLSTKGVLTEPYTFPEPGIIAWVPPRWEAIEDEQILVEGESYGEAVFSIAAACILSGANERAPWTAEQVVQAYQNYFLAWDYYSEPEPVLTSLLAYIGTKSPTFQEPMRRLHFQTVLDWTIRIASENSLSSVHNLEKIRPEQTLFQGFFLQGHRGQVTGQGELKVRVFGQSSLVTAAVVFHESIHLNAQAALLRNTPKGELSSEEWILLAQEEYVAQFHTDTFRSVIGLGSLMEDRSFTGYHRHILSELNHALRRLPSDRYPNLWKALRVMEGIGEEKLEARYQEALETSLR